jgi:CBS domain containing-hemolysin-like protein
MPPLTPLELGIRLLGVFALVLVNGFFVAAEFALVTVRKTRIDQLVSEGHRRARIVRRATTNPDGYIAATQLGITMASIGLGWVGEPAVASTIQPLLTALPLGLAVITAHTVATALAFALITALHIVLGELAPKTIALQNAEATALVVAGPTDLFMKIFWPFIAALNAMGRAVVRGLGMKPPSRHSLVHSEEELKMLVTASQEAGVIEEQEEQMLHRVFGFADLTAAQVMVPRTEIVAVRADATLEQVAEQVRQLPHAWLPVYRENLDDIAGAVSVTDLFGRVAAGGTAAFNLGSLVRDVLVVPETMTADDLLDDMRRQRVRLAVVIDEYGSTAGLVTFQGLMERIVGEVVSEFNPAGTRIRALPDGAALVDGLVLVADVNERFGLHIDETTYNTIGGYVLGRLGGPAQVGEAIEVERRLVRVEALDGRRVARVLITPPKA